jgi:hypothetical protein
MKADTSPFTPSSRQHAWRKLVSGAMSGLMLVCAILVMAPIFLVLFS